MKPRSPNPQIWTWPKKARLSWLQVGSSCHLFCRACTTCPTPVSTAPGPVPPVRIESSSSTVAEGQTLDLSCVVAGQAHAQVTWYKRGGSLPARHQVHVVSKGEGAARPSGGQWFAGVLAPELRDWQSPAQRSGKRAGHVLGPGKRLSHACPRCPGPWLPPVHIPRITS